MKVYYELTLAPPGPPANVPKGNKGKTYVKELISVTGDHEPAAGETTRSHQKSTASST